MRKSTKDARRKKRKKALKLLQSLSYKDQRRGRKLLKQANKQHYPYTTSNF